MQMMLEKEHRLLVLVQGRESEEMFTVPCGGFDKITVISCSSPKREKLCLCILLVVDLCL